MRILMMAAMVMTVVLGGCGDDGGDPGAVYTKGEACTDLSGPYCERAQACGALGGATVQTCESQFVNSCCTTNHTCTIAAAVTADQVQTCGDAFQGYDCQALENNDLPPACLTI